MKIFLPTIQYPPDAGGVAKVAHEQARHLARGGDEVLVYSPHAGPEEILETEPNLNLHRPTLRARAILRLVPLILRTNNALKSFAPDFALCPTYRAMGLPVMLSATKHRVPYCIYLHGTELQTEHKSAPRRLIMRTVLDRAAFLATNSHNTRKLLEKLYPALRPSVVVVHPGVEPDRFSEAQLSPLRLSSRTNLMNRFAPVAASMMSCVQWPTCECVIRFCPFIM
jgi:glycosyltransferase involved in cell wall biosynthesis